MSDINVTITAPAVINVTVTALDTTPPTCTIVLSDSALSAGETAAVTLTFSQKPVDFDINDLTAQNGTLSSLPVTADPKVYPATLTPAADTDDATNVITLGTGWTNVYGIAPAGASTSANYTVHTARPTCSITLSDYDIITGDTPTVTFTFSSAPSGFTVADVTAPNGTLSAFGVTGDPLVYTATFTPDEGVTDLTNVITVGTGWADAYGNAPAGESVSSN